MSMIKAFYGKQISTSSYVLEMMLREKKINFIPYLNCITTEVFNHICYPYKPGKWLVPYPNGWESIQIGMSNIGLNKVLETVEITNKTYKELLLQMKEWIKSGSFILGPLDPTPIWNRLETRYYKGFNRYIFVLEHKKDNIFIAHDPEGCPYFQIEADKIFQALNYSENQYYMFRLNELNSICSEDNIYRNIICCAIKNRRDISNLPENICKGLSQLSLILSERRIKSSEVAELIFACSEINIALINMIEFFSNPPMNIKKEKSLNEVYLNKIIDILCEYEKTIARLLISIKQADNRNVILCFREIIKFEQILDIYLPKLLY